MSVSRMEVEEAKIKYLQLKDIKGHWNGAESNPDVDHYNGEKHQAMNALLEEYGKPGTPVKDILEVLGKPDEMTETLPHLKHSQSTNINSVDTFNPAAMPGPVIGGASDLVSAGNDPNGQTYYITYKWRGNHDYIYFKISPDDTVSEAKWYHAYE